MLVHPIQREVQIFLLELLLVEIMLLEIKGCFWGLVQVNQILLVIVTFF